MKRELRGVLADNPEVLSNALVPTISSRRFNMANSPLVRLHLLALPNRTANPLESRAYVENDRRTCLEPGRVGGFHPTRSAPVAVPSRRQRARLRSLLEGRDHAPL